MAPKQVPVIAPKRPLVLPKKATLTPPKPFSLPTAIKAKSLGTKAPLVLSKGGTPLDNIVPKIPVKAVPTLNVAEALERKLSLSSQGSMRISETGSNGPDAMDIPLSRRAVSSSLSIGGDLDNGSQSYVSNGMDEERSVPMSATDKLLKERLRLSRMSSRGSDHSYSQRHAPSSHDNDANARLRSNVVSRHEELPSREVNRKGKMISRQVSETDSQKAVGETPWLQIERRINEIRSMASANMHQISARHQESTAQAPPSLYGNYNTHYEQKSEWKKERTSPLSYGMIQNLRSKKPAISAIKNSWDAVDGYLRPSRKPFASMSELSRHFRHIKPNDQSELIKLLLACRELEKVIEEQHTVLDMLDHDLREARELLKLPDNLRDVSSKPLIGNTPQEKPFYPTSDVPLFIKGRVSLLPGANDLQLSVVENR